MQNNQDTLERLIGGFGIDALIKALPQDEVRKSLDLVSLEELAAMIGLKYSTLRWHMNRGKIPFPQVRLVRRAFFTRSEADTIVRAWKQGESSLGTKRQK